MSFLRRQESITPKPFETEPFDPIENSAVPILSSIFHLLHSTMTYDCAIIGAGPTGIISAIQLKRSGFSVILFEKNEIGGLLRNANLVENYLGFPGGVSGSELVAIFHQQLKKFKIQLVKAEVTSICHAEEETRSGSVSKHESKAGIYQIQTPKKTYHAKTIIVATGTTPKTANLPGEAELVGKKVFYEIADFLHCHSNGQKCHPCESRDLSPPNSSTTPLSSPPKTPSKPIRDKRYEIPDTIILGSGDAAFDYALNLHKQGHHPTIVMRDVPNCLPLLQKRVAQQKIPVFENLHPLRLCHSRESGNLSPRPAKTTSPSSPPKTPSKPIRDTRYHIPDTKIALVCKEKTFIVDYVLIAVGREPTFPQIDIPDQASHSSQPGLFFAGDVQHSGDVQNSNDTPVIPGSDQESAIQNSALLKTPPYRQVHIATGDGLKAALNVIKYLQKISTK